MALKRVTLIIEYETDKVADPFPLFETVVYKLRQHSGVTAWVNTRYRWTDDRAGWRWWVYYWLWWGPIGTIVIYGLVSQ